MIFSQTELNVFKQLIDRFRQSWRQFLIIHVTVNVLIFLLLGPLAAALLRLAISLSGDVALSDEDILFFILSPLGFAAFVVLAAVSSIILFLEYAALITVARAEEIGRPMSVWQVLVLLAARALGLFQLAVMILLRVLLALLPFLVLLGLVYLLLLSDYDINYYMAVKPPEWLMALGLAALVGAVFAVFLLWLVSGWLFSLPLLLAGSSPRQAINESRKASVGYRLVIVRSLLLWLLFSIVITGITSLVIALLSKVLLPLGVGSVNALLLVMSSVSLLGFLASFLVTFLSTALLSLVILSLFENRGLAREESAHALVEEGQRATRLPGRRWLAVGMIVAFLVSMGTAYHLLNELEFENPVAVMAHRGASAAAPENTMAAVQLAIDSGAEWVEIDVQETADGEVVVIHDRDLQKIGRVPLAVASNTLAKLREVDIGSWFAPEFHDQRIPTLREVLEACRGRINVNIELKYYGQQVMLEQRVADIVDSLGMADQIVVMSLSLPGIREMSRIRPEWTTGLLSSVSLGDLAQLDVDFLAINARFASRPLVRHIHDQGKKVMVWTVNDTIGIASMASRGVDAIITDEPALAVSVVEQLEALEPAQRLLIQLADVFEQPSLYLDQ